MGLGSAFESAALSGLLKFLIAGIQDELVTAKQLVLRGDVTDPGVQTHRVVMVNKPAAHPQSILQTERRFGPDSVVSTRTSA
jgi:hypothetical protein